jgi:hypothetical protein
LKLSITALVATLLLACTAQAQTGPVSSQGPAGRPGSGGDTLVTTQVQFVSAVNAAIAGCYVVNFATGSRFVVTGTMNFTLKDCGQDPVGWNGNGLRIANDNGAVNNGGGIIRVTSSAQNRSFVATGTAVSGGGWKGYNAGDCVSIAGRASGGAPIYKFTLRDWWIDYCGGHGLVITNDVYEGAVYNLQTENNNGSGVFLNHGPLGISNIFLIGLNSSRNKGYGAESSSGAFGVPLTQVSFINNAKGGARFPSGIRSVTSGNCENSGQVCIDVGAPDLATTIFNVEASTDCGVQHAGGTGIMKYAWKGSGTADKFWTGALFITGYGKCNASHGVQVRAP